MQFIRVGNTYLNADHIMVMRTGADGITNVLLSDGSEERGKISDDFFARLFPQIPAAPGFYEVRCTQAKDGTRDWSLAAIVAWQYAPSGVWPVAIGPEVTDQDYTGILHPDGTVTDDCEVRHDTLDAYKQAVEAEDRKRAMGEAA